MQEPSVAQREGSSKDDHTALTSQQQQQQDESHDSPAGAGAGVGNEAYKREGRQRQRIISQGRSQPHRRPAPDFTSDEATAAFIRRTLCRRRRRTSPSPSPVPVPPTTSSDTAAVAADEAAPWGPPKHPPHQRRQQPRGRLARSPDPPSSPLLPAQLPPLTSSNAVDLQLYAIIAVVVKEFIRPWYSRVTTAEDDLVEELIRLLAHCTRALEQRARKLDAVELLLDELPALLEAHIIAYRTAHRPLQPSPWAADPQEIYHTLRPHPALSPVPIKGRRESGKTEAQLDVEWQERVREQEENEAAWRQLLVQGLLAVLLPTEDLAQASLRSLLTGLLADKLLGDVVGGLMCQPSFLWDSLAKLLLLVGKRTDRDKLAAAPPPKKSLPIHVGRNETVEDDPLGATRSSSSEGVAVDKRSSRPHHRSEVTGSSTTGTSQSAEIKISPEIEPNAGVATAYESEKANGTTSAARSAQSWMWRILHYAVLVFATLRAALKIIIARSSRAPRTKGRWIEIHQERLKSRKEAKHSLLRPPGQDHATARPPIAGAELAPRQPWSGENPGMETAALTSKKSISPGPVPARQTSKGISEGGGGRVAKKFTDEERATHPDSKNRFDGTEDDGIDEYDDLEDFDDESPRPIIGMRLWSCIGRALDLDGRMPWLSGLSALAQWAALNGPGRLGRAVGFIDRVLVGSLPPSSLPPFPTLLRAFRTELLPNNSIAAGKPPPTATTTATETAARRRCADALALLVPDAVLRAWAGSSSSNGSGGHNARDQLERDVLAVLDDAFLNRHLVFAAVELVLLRLVPELGERTPAEIAAERGVVVGKAVG